MKLESMKPGQVVYSVGRQKMGNTTISTVAVWSVRIHSVDLDRRKVVASWNGNTPKSFNEREATKWRATEPVLIRSGFNARLATREEIKKMRADTGGASDV